MYLIFSRKSFYNFLTKNPKKCGMESFRKRQQNTSLSTCSGGLCHSTEESKLMCFCGKENEINDVTTRKRKDTRCLRKVCSLDKNAICDHLGRRTD